MAIKTELSGGAEKSWIGLMMGQTARDIIRSGSTSEGKYRLLIVLEEATINTLEDSLIVNGSFNAGDVLPTNTVLGGEFSNISISSGIIIACR